ncbi:site-specific integrase [Streptomyces sp. DR7-3]|uniref:site-specific integrase n=1 Tax=Streptomyces malaysiensis TaxID=92644 RepID=UPI002044AAA4|nr:site-specific integrase [Streptomyces sp. DR7-3]MCM3809347.1 site-specific integrase [Streptomyces sp. DR7-3]
MSGEFIRNALADVLAYIGPTDSTGQPLDFAPHDFRRLFITDAIRSGLPPHIAQVIAGHTNINTTMGCHAIYPTETIEAHRAFITRRCALRPAEEYRTPTDDDWEDFLGYFERRKLSVGTCARAYGTVCIYEHARVRCSLLPTRSSAARPPGGDPRQPPRPHRRGRAGKLARRNRKTTGQPGRSPVQDQPDRQGLPDRAGDARHAGPGTCVSAVSAERSLLPSLGLPRRPRPPPVGRADLVGGMNRRSCRSPQGGTTLRAKVLPPEELLPPSHKEIGVETPTYWLI